jgi:putative transposase
MPRRLRFASGGLVYHVLNRAVARARIFDNTRDYVAFERVLKQAKARLPLRLLA